MSAQVRSVAATATLQVVAEILVTYRISCAVVVDVNGPVGIISERDLVRIVVEDPVGWAHRTASEVMTRPLHVTDPEASVVDATNELARRGIRRLPVVSRDGRLDGIVTQTDLLRASNCRLEEYACDLERLVGERTAALRASEARRNELVDLTVHDVKNWLQAADASLQIAGQDPAQVENLLPLLRHATSRIAGLLRTLLDVNRLESGRMPLRLMEVPWPTLCEPVAAEAAVMAHEKSLTLVQTGDMHSIVRCDPELIERVILNLLGNAITAASPGSGIDIHTNRRSDGTFRVRIGNRGPVIPREVLPTLFQRYGQGTTGNAVKRFGGWGLGLTFCQLVVHHHGGTIDAISPYMDGEGAAFEFVLPPDPERATVRATSGPSPMFA
jgi:signal transduction histidine kinase